MSGGTAGTGTGGELGATGGAGGAGSACEASECFRAFQCVRACGGPVEYSGCCPCEPPLFDDFGATACGLSALCTGSTPRMVVNGVTTTPTGVELLPQLHLPEGSWSPQRLRQPIAVQWRVEPARA